MSSMLTRQKRNVVGFKRAQRRRLPPELLHEMVQCTLFEQSAKLANLNKNRALTIWALRHHKRLRATIDTLLLGLDAVKAEFAKSSHTFPGNCIGQMHCHYKIAHSYYESLQHLCVVSGIGGVLVAHGEGPHNWAFCRHFTPCHMTVTSEEIAFWELTLDTVSMRETLTAVAFLPFSDNKLRVHVDTGLREIRMERRDAWERYVWYAHGAPAGHFWTHLTFRPATTAECVALKFVLNAQMTAFSRRMKGFF